MRWDPTIAVLVALAAAPVSAAEPKLLAVVRPRLVGGANPALAGEVAALLASGLGGVAVRRLPTADVDRVVGDCVDAGCVNQLRGALQADLVLRATLTLTGRDFKLLLELLEARGGAIVVRSEQSCDLCGRGELKAQVAEQIQRMLPALQAAVEDPPRLQVVTDPPGAQVHVDEQRVGVTPYDEEVLLGSHTLRVTYPRHSPVERTFEAGPGSTRQRLELRRSPATMRLRGAGWGLLAIGAATLAGGVSLLVIDGRCSSAVRDAAGECPRLYDTDWGGAGLVMAGVGLVTAGTVTLVRTRKRSGHRVRVAPRVGRTGVAVSLAWRF